MRTYWITFSLALFITANLQAQHSHNRIRIDTSYYANGNIRQIVGVIGCKRVGRHINYYENGKVQKIRFFKNGKANGLWKEYYENGQLQRKSHYVLGKIAEDHKVYNKAGKMLFSANYNNVKAMPYKEYYDNQITVSGTIKNQLPINKWEYHYDNGILKKVENFNNQSQLDGITAEYYENGQLESSGNYSQNKPTAKWTYYAENGELTSITVYNQDGEQLEWETYKNNKIIQKNIYTENLNTRITYYKNGQTKEEKYFSKDYKDTGKWKTYYYDGVLKSEGNYKDDKKEGEWKFYDNDGNLEKTENYINGKREGKWYYYSKDGSIYSEENYKNDKEHGIWKYYSCIDHQCKERFISEKKTYKNGLKDGKWITFFRDNTVREIEVYKEGKPIGLHIKHYSDGSVEEIFDFTKPIYSLKKYAYNGNIVLSRFYKGKTGDKYFPWKRVGLYQEFYENGNKKITGTYKDNDKSGTWKYYYRNGQTRAIENYTNGIRDGLWETYYLTETRYINTVINSFDSVERKKTKLSGKYKLGKKIGDWTSFDEDGKIIKITKHD